MERTWSGQQQGALFAGSRFWYLHDPPTRLLRHFIRLVQYVGNQLLDAEHETVAWIVALIAAEARGP